MKLTERDWKGKEGRNQRRPLIVKTGKEWTLKMARMEGIELEAAIFGGTYNKTEPWKAWKEWNGMEWNKDKEGTKKMNNN